MSADPIESEAQVEEIDWFWEIHVKAGPAAAQLIGSGRVRAHGDRDDTRIALPNLRNEIVPVPVWQADITKDQIHLMILQEGEASRRRFTGEDLVPPAFENNGERSPRIEMIFN